MGGGILFRQRSTSFIKSWGLPYIRLCCLVLVSVDEIEGVGVLDARARKSLEGSTIHFLFGTQVAILELRLLVVFDRCEVRESARCVRTMKYEGSCKRLRDYVRYSTV